MISGTKDPWDTVYAIGFVRGTRCEGSMGNPEGAEHRRQCLHAYRRWSHARMVCQTRSIHSSTPQRVSRVASQLTDWPFSTIFFFAHYSWLHLQHISSSHYIQTNHFFLNCILGRVLETVEEIYSIMRRRYTFNISDKSILPACDDSYMSTSCGYRYSSRGEPMRFLRYSSIL